MIKGLRKECRKSICVNEEFKGGNFLMASCLKTATKRRKKRSKEMGRGGWASSKGRGGTRVLGGGKSRGVEVGSSNAADKY